MARHSQSTSTPRSEELYLVGYFLARFTREKPGAKRSTLPPAKLNANSWADAYMMFYASLGGGRGEKTFASTLKNARDIFDRHLPGNSRAGWDAPLPQKARHVLGEYASFNHDELWVRVEPFVDVNAKSIRSHLPKMIPRESILKALARIDAYGYAPHRKNHTFELVHGGRGYPPLAVLSFAIEDNLGTVVAPGSLRGEDRSPEFAILRDAGFPIARIHLDGQADEELNKKSGKQGAKKKRVVADPGSETPKKTITEVVVYERDPDVHAFVSSRAKGICEGCGQPSGFNRKNGEPYLEVHHVIPLSEGGPDKTSNAVALCPNCHKRCHYAQDGEEYNRNLYHNIETLCRPATHSGYQD